MPIPARQRDSPSAERIILTGFMGSGKSTIGPLLAAQLRWNFLDLDDEIERRTGLNIPAIFEQKGEAHFRREETAALAAALCTRHTVIALGGGAPETLANRLLLKQASATLVVYLAAPFSTLAARCAQQASDPASTGRPVFADPSAAEQRFAARQPVYHQLADHSIDTQGLTPEATAAAIAQIVLRNLTRV